MMSDERPLVLAIIEALLLLESASDDEIDPDTAVRGMENISTSLHKLTPDDQRRLRAVFDDVAAASDRGSYSTFVSGLGDALGLAAADS